MTRSGPMVISNGREISGIPTNILRGIVPTASGWGTAPTSLANCTDGNSTTVTGTGSSVMGAAGDYGILVFDLGSVKNVIVGATIGLWATANVTRVVCEGSVDNITYRGEGVNVASSPPMAADTQAAEKVMDTLALILIGIRYFRLRFYVGAISTASAKIYEVTAYELGS